MSQISTKFIANGAITNLKVSASAAIAYSKLNLSASIVNADIASGAAIVYNKLSLAASILASDMNSGAAASGDVLTANGSGGSTYVTPTVYANRTLSNLTSPTAINQNLLPDTSNTRNIGSSVNYFATIHGGSLVADTGSISANDGSGNTTALLLAQDSNSSPSGATGFGLALRAPYIAGSQALKSEIIYTRNDTNSDANASGQIRLETGNKTSGTGNSGNITLLTGTSSGGARGQIILSGLSIDASTSQIHNVVDPTSAQDAATKAYVDASSGTGITALTGDVTASGPGSAAATLATVNSNVGSFGSSTSIPSFTVNAKGLITAASGNVVVAPAGTLSGTTLNSSVVTSSLTSLGAQAAALDMGTHLINNVVDPVSAQDAATKNYVDTHSSSVTPSKETFILSGTDITNQYVDLSQVAITDSISFMVQGAGSLLEGASYDYSVSYTGGAGGKTRITFLNDIATGGPSALVATDVVQVNYLA